MAESVACPTGQKPDAIPSAVPAHLVWRHREALSVEEKEMFGQCLGFLRDLLWSVEVEKG